MADQKIITLYPGDAAPNDVVLRDLPVAGASAGTTIYLLPGDAAPNDVILGDPSSSPATVTPFFVLAATEAADILSFSVQEGFVLAATEQPDVASFSVQEGFRLSATEAADALAFTLVEGANLTLAATEASDVASFDVALAAVVLDLAATEGADVASFDVSLAATPAFDLAATEEPDVAAFDVLGDAPVVAEAPRGAAADWLATAKRRPRPLTDYPVASYPATPLAPTGDEVAGNQAGAPAQQATRAPCPPPVALVALPDLARLALRTAGDQPPSINQLAELALLIEQRREAALNSALQDALDEDDVEILLLAA